MLADLTEMVIGVVERLGYLGVAFLVALENLFPPIPSEVVLPLAGFVAGTDDASLPGMVLAATVGSIVGAWALYGIAAAIGPRGLHAIVGRYGRWLRIDEHDLRRAETWFDRRSDTAVLIGRCVPLIRSIISIPAGFRRMPLLRFTALTAFGSLMWNVVLISSGALLGDRWEQVGGVVGLLQAVVILAMVAVLGVFVRAKYLRPRLAAAGDLPPPDQHM